MIAYLGGRADASEYLHIFHNPGLSELCIVMMALVGACFGFLWFNCHPAKVFMGDTGSLAIGGAIGMTAICAKQEFLLVIIGFVFVMEAGLGYPSSWRVVSSAANVYLRWLRFITTLNFVVGMKTKLSFASGLFLFFAA